jgi:prophage regulatory protein
MKTKSMGTASGTVAGLPRYLPWAEVIELTGMSRSTLKRAIRDEAFPAPRKLTRGRVGFRHDEIAVWVETRPQAKGEAAREVRRQRRALRE